MRVGGIGTAFNSLDRQQDEARDKVRPPVRTPYPTGKLEPLNPVKPKPDCPKKCPSNSRPRPPVRPPAWP